MRKILFKGKRIDNGGWIYGSPIFQDGYVLIRFWNSEEFKFEEHLIAPESVSEYTGLTDKNGTKIFEGDVILYPWSDQDKPQRFTIKFKDGQFVASPVKETEDYWDFMVGGYSKEMEVIDNIHDNPELLKGE